MSKLLHFYIASSSFDWTTAWVISSSINISTLIMIIKLRIGVSLVHEVWAFVVRLDSSGPLLDWEFVWFKFKLLWMIIKRIKLTNQMSNPFNDYVIYISNVIHKYSLRQCTPQHNAPLCHTWSSLDCFYQKKWNSAFIC